MAKLPPSPTNDDSDQDADGEEDPDYAMDTQQTYTPYSGVPWQAQQMTGYGQHIRPDGMGISIDPLLAGNEQAGPSDTGAEQVSSCKSAVNLLFNPCIYSIHTTLLNKLTQDTITLLSTTLHPPRILSHHIMNPPQAPHTLYHQTETRISRTSPNTRRIRTIPTSTPRHPLRKTAWVQQHLFHHPPVNLPRQLV